MGPVSMLHTDLANDLIVLQYAPGDVDAVVVPVGARHMLIDVCIHASHDDRGQLPSSPTMETKGGGVRRGATESRIK